MAYSASEELDYTTTTTTNAVGKKLKKFVFVRKEKEEEKTKVSPAKKINKNNSIPFEINSQWESNCHL